ncbi:sensor histidine kinase [Paenibacillus radicis (ex Xue et al. 2023)]|uniref:histidine kinase n=1 Tax=Paenibacillus radicis (ex Xue et al. 2023) TaxID=2972489 RepID=A0ABT1Y950_9BACL|nr:HAMP domain-containing sensor histidine kinase [Paenibacillus radicis (ex Xue et al. 2023)]MCR8629718.1 HAMP domain-containing histidine kinase [Paenibacillus radicis (ex Xue et al. 2023)]
MTILLLVLMAASITLFITKAKNPSAYWMALVLLGWFISMSGLVLFIAKYGGFYYKVNIVLFFNDSIRNLLLHSPVTIEAISRMITIGRSLFIFSLIGLSVTLFYYRPFLKIWKIYAFNSILPLLNILFYDPVIYKWALSVLDRDQTYIIGWVTRGWLVISTLAALFFMVWRYKRITIHWFKSQVKYTLLGVLALVLFYFYLGFMGPLQVFDVRTYYVLYSDFSNFNPPLTLVEWYLSIGFTGILSIISILSIWKYTEVEKKLGKLDLQLERKLSTADMGTKVFTHAIKNQLLMMQILLQRTDELLHTESPPLQSASAIEANVNKVSGIVSETLQRLDQLYNSFKTTYLQLKPVDVHELLQHTLDKFKAIPEHVTLINDFPQGHPVILADQEHLTETIYNIMINAIEAIDKETTGIVSIHSYLEDDWLIIKIEDNGSGIAQDQIEQIFDPFYTNKNTTKNWGVGLSYAKQIVKGHFGDIHVQSKPGVGSTFQLLLPVYIKDELNTN